MQIPQPLIQSLQGLPGFQAQRFIDAHDRPEPVTSIRLNPSKPVSHATLFDGDIPLNPVPWSSLGYYLQERPSFTFDPLFHAGCYYVQEASSMFLEQVLRQTVDLTQPLRVLDLCAAPGGKSTHLQSLLSADSLLVSNEVIRARTQILKDNIIKWGTANVAVTTNDPADFAALNGYFDVIVVDAPCSGSGLFRRDEAAVGEWSEHNVSLCSQRQQRILADVLPALKTDGVLVYSTCSYSPQEDEQILDWLCKTFDMESIPLKVDDAWQITTTRTGQNAYGYRFWPYHVKGEGFFLTVLKKREYVKTLNIPKPSLKQISMPSKTIVSKWLRDIETMSLVSFGDKIYAWPEKLFNDFNLLAKTLRVVYSGTAIGTLMRDKLVPDHAMAMSPLRSEEIIMTLLEKDAAIAYLSRKDFETDAPKGWQLAAYKHQPLGWMNILPNRINNYYPKELKILKAQ
ncbi:MAG: RsmF rRNA methyltransferase first C-terminal domain-containing protein [Niabella sp.]